MKYCVCIVQQFYNLISYSQTASCLRKREREREREREMVPMHNIFIYERDNEISTHCVVYKLFADKHRKCICAFSRAAQCLFMHLVTSQEPLLNLTLKQSTDQHALHKGRRCLRCSRYKQRKPQAKTDLLPPKSTTILEVIIAYFY